MAGGRRKTAPSPSKTGGETKVAVEEDAVIDVDESSSESEVKKLRGRWELASILNFLSVRSSILIFQVFSLMVSLQHKHIVHRSYLSTFRIGGGCVR